MRAVYYPFEQYEIGQNVQVSGDTAHHLNVVRVKLGEEILLLNGKGSKLNGKVISVEKKLVEVLVTKTETFKHTHNLSLAIANPKKDAFEDILKAAVELGIKNIYPLSSEFSQYDYVRSERVDRILESALVQSNNPFYPEIHTQLRLTDFLKGHKETLVFFNSRSSEVDVGKVSTQENTTILIGPEGGFSTNEVNQICAYAKILEIHLPTPILRAPTAVPASVGYLLALANNLK